VNAVKINEVEALVGITKKNIRFYEAEGLLTPRRDSGNGYRDYGETEVNTLRHIKLLRKLGVPLEEIRSMQSGTHTVGDGLKRHLITLERDRANLEQSIALCRKLADCPDKLADLDAGAILEEMENLEQSGTTFQNRQDRDIRVRYVGPIIAAVVMTGAMAAAMALMVWAFVTDPAEAPPLPLMVLLLAIPAVIVAGVLLALFQRIQEIRKGEIDDARIY
jgi:DNA-binding transcriptional MerR regulator